MTPSATRRETADLPPGSPASRPATLRRPSRLPPHADKELDEVERPTGEGVPTEHARRVTGTKRWWGMSTLPEDLLWLLPLLVWAFVIRWLMFVLFGR